jgi:hypothetical protein
MPIIKFYHVQQTSIAPSWSNGRNAVQTTGDRTTTSDPAKENKKSRVFNSELGGSSYRTVPVNASVDNKKPVYSQLCTGGSATANKASKRPSEPRHNKKVLRFRFCSGTYSGIELTELFTGTLRALCMAAQRVL